MHLVREIAVDPTVPVMLLMAYAPEMTGSRAKRYVYNSRGTGGMARITMNSVDYPNLSVIVGSRLQFKGRLSILQAVALYVRRRYPRCGSVFQT